MVNEVQNIALQQNSKLFEHNTPCLHLVRVHGISESPTGPTNLVRVYRA